jgi:hypothetical protein
MDIPEDHYEKYGVITHFQSEAIHPAALPPMAGAFVIVGFLWAGGYDGSHQRLTLRRNQKSKGGKP